MAPRSTRAAKMPVVMARSGSAELAPPWGCAAEVGLHSRSGLTARHQTLRRQTKLLLEPLPCHVPKKVLAELRLMLGAVRKTVGEYFAPTHPIAACPASSVSTARTTANGLSPASCSAASTFRHTDCAVGTTELRTTATRPDKSFLGWLHSRPSPFPHSPIEYVVQPTVAVGITVGRPGRPKCPRLLYRY